MIRNLNVYSNSASLPLFKHKPRKPINPRKSNMQLQKSLLLFAVIATLTVPSVVSAKPVQISRITPLAAQRIDSDEGNLPAGLLENGDRFGRSVISIGDLDQDGVIDLAVGARSDDDGGTDAGAVYILFMNADLTVKSTSKISATSGGFDGPEQ